MNAAVFHRVPLKTVGAWDTDVAAPGLARVAGGLSLGLWTGVIACGRLLACFQAGEASAASVRDHGRRWPERV